MAMHGVLDLRSVDLYTSNPLPLDGEWQFYWQELLEPDEGTEQPPALVNIPHLWNEDPNYQAKGFGTYKLTILLPEQYPELSLSIPDMYTAYAMYINGKLMAQNGVVGTTENTTVARWYPQTISLKELGQPPVLDILIQVSNFKHYKGGIRIPITLGTTKELTTHREQELGYNFILSGALIMGGLFFLGLFFFSQIEKSILYFALFCLVYSYRIIGTELYAINLIFPELPWEIAVRLEYLTLYLSAALFGQFLKNLYTHEVNNYIMNGIGIIFLMFSVSAIIMPIYYFTSLINLFFGLVGFYIIYAILIIIRAKLNKRVGSLYTLISLVVLFVIFGWDLLEYFVMVEENLAISFIGYTLFFFLQSITLSNRFAYRLNEAKERAESAILPKPIFFLPWGTNCAPLLMR